MLQSAFSLNRTSLAACCLALCLAPSILTEASAYEVTSRSATTNSHQTNAACLPSTKNLPHCQSKRMIFAGQCESNCQIVRNHCVAIGNDRSSCNDDYRVCMNSC
jgi:hypothetical protein